MWLNQAITGDMPEILPYPHKACPSGSCLLDLEDLEPDQVPLRIFLFSFLGNLGWKCGCSCPVIYECEFWCAQVTKLLLCICSSDRGDMPSPLVISTSISLHLSQSVPWPWVQHTLAIHAQLSLLRAIQKPWQVVKLFFCTFSASRW